MKPTDKQKEPTSKAILKAKAAFSKAMKVLGGEWGYLGGTARAKRYTKEEMAEMSRRGGGGRPKGSKDKKKRKSRKIGIKS